MLEVDDPGSLVLVVDYNLLLHTQILLIRHIGLSLSSSTPKSFLSDTSLFLLPTPKSFLSDISLSLLPTPKSFLSDISLFSGWVLSHGNIPSGVI